MNHDRLRAGMAARKEEEEEQESFDPWRVFDRSRTQTTPKSPLGGEKWEPYQARKGEEGDREVSSQRSIEYDGYPFRQMDTTS